MATIEKAIDVNVPAQVAYDQWTQFEEFPGDLLGFMTRRVEGDLKRFKHFIEERGDATGTWRGKIDSRDERSHR